MSVSTAREGLSTAKGGGGESLILLSRSGKKLRFARRPHAQIPKGEKPP